MELNAEFYVLIGFLIFVGILWYVGLPGMISSHLHTRRQRIQHELDQAVSLRREAESLLASFEQRAKEAEKEAAAIVAQAKVDADLIAQESTRRVEEYIARQTRQAEEKIQLAKLQAEADVRAAAAQSAVDIAETVLKQKVANSQANTPFVEAAIADLPALVSSR